MKKILFIITLCMIASQVRAEFFYLSREQMTKITIGDFHDTYQEILNCSYQYKAKGRAFEECLLVDDNIFYNYKLTKSQAKDAFSFAKEVMLDECLVEFPSGFCSCFIDKMSSADPVKLYSDKKWRMKTIRHESVKCTLPPLSEE